MSTEALNHMSKEELLAIAEDLAAKQSAQEEGMGNQRDSHYDLHDVVRALQAKGVTDEEIARVTQS